MGLKVKRLYFVLSPPLRFLALRQIFISFIVVGLFINFLTSSSDKGCHQVLLSHTALNKNLCHKNNTFTRGENLRFFEELGTFLA